MGWYRISMDSATSNYEMMSFLNTAANYFRVDWSTFDFEQEEDRDLAVRATIVHEGRTIRLCYALKSNFHIYSIECVDDGRVIPVDGTRQSTINALNTLCHTSLAALARGISARLERL